MARSWANENTVVSSLLNAGYYPSDPNSGKEQLQAQFVEEEVVTINGKSYTLSRISKYDVKIFGDELDGALSRMNPFIWDIFSKYAVNCLAAVRLANQEHTQGYRGANARGNELDASFMNARQFFDPDALPSRRISWVRTIAAVVPPAPSIQAFFCDSTGVAVPYTTNEEECLIFLGWYDPATSPCSDMFQISLNTDLYDWQDMDFDKVQTEQADVIYELKEPFILPPEEAGLINVGYFANGTDELRPIGLWVKEAKNMRAMATP
jgi:hypothetical protein